MALSALALPIAQILAESDSEGGAGNVGFLFMAAGFVFYSYVYIRYRNSDKRHRHETETKVELHDIRARDEFYRSLSGLSNSSMEGANDKKVYGAQHGSS